MYPTQEWLDRLNTAQIEAGVDLRRPRAPPLNAMAAQQWLRPLRLVSW
jgi:hypothetical protein